MRIITYAAIGDAPENMRAAASMVPDGPGTHWTTTGATPEEAEAKLRVFLASQSVKYGGEGKKPKAAKPTPQNDDVGEVI